MLAWLCGMLATSAQGVEVSPGQLHQAGTELTASPYGVTLTVPPSAVAVVGDDAISIGNPLSALGTRVSATPDDLSSLRAQLGHSFTTGTVTWTARDVHTQGGHLVADLSGTALLGGARTGRYEAIRGPHGWTVVVVTSGKPQHASALASLHVSVVSSVRLDAEGRLLLDGDRWYVEALDGACD